MNLYGRNPMSRADIVS